MLYLFIDQQKYTKYRIKILIIYIKSGNKVNSSFYIKNNGINNLEK
jgi:hypothetical protein